MSHVFMLFTVLFVVNIITRSSGSPSEVITGGNAAVSSAKGCRYYFQRRFQMSPFLCVIISWLLAG